ncbi:MAG: transporter substrate-binding domain-containing protein [Rhodobacteraceae bacterium]|nr:transporter substrate-binding domain-containing protein [Paracoccaceae bacterium]
MRGDTLRTISERYYGTRELSSVIYGANIGTVGKDPNTIEIGMSLAIPCRDGFMPPLPGAFSTITEPREANGQSPAPQFLAKSGGAAFMSQNGNGVIPDILAAALRKGGYRDSLEMERPANSDTILRLAAMEASTLLSFPWIKPDCDTPSHLSAQSTDLCKNFVFSDPLFETTLGLFTRADAAQTTSTSASDLSGSRFCLPQFHSDTLLRSMGLTVEAEDITRAPDFNTCVTGLLSGMYNVIVADYQSYSTFYRGHPAEVVDISLFARQVTLHAVAYRKNPDALSVLQIANSGLEQIMASGEWFGIVQEHLSPRTN